MLIHQVLPLNMMDDEVRRSRTHAITMKKPIVQCEVTIDVPGTNELISQPWLQDR